MSWGLNWRRFLERAKVDREQQQELESYIEITTEEFMAQGMGVDEARRAARRELGNVTRIREEVWEMNTVALWDIIVRELRQALRMLRLNPAFSITAVLTLALGIGATTAIFSVVNAVVIQPLPYPDSDRVLTVTHSAVFGNVRGNNFPFSAQMLAVYREGTEAFEEIGIFQPGQAAVTGNGDPEQVNTLLINAGLLRVLGVQPALGRWVSYKEDQPGAPATALLTQRYWQRGFGGDPEVIGRTVTVDGRPRQIVGVLPRNFELANTQADLLLPLQLDMAAPPGDFNYRAIGRMKEGFTAEQANADIGRMMPIFIERYAGNRMDALHLLPAVRPFKEDVVGNVGQLLWVLLGSISILFLISCANVANLLLVRTEGRGQELAVRAALGSGWRHLVRTLMVEGLTLSLIGGAIGLGLTYFGLRALVLYGPASLPRLQEIALDPPVLVFASTVSVAAGLMFGLIPILKMARLKTGLRLPEFIGGGGRWASAGTHQQRSQNMLVVTQVALALMLLVGSGLMIRTFQNLRNVAPGFIDPARVQTVRVGLPNALGAEPDRVVQLQTRILEQLRAIPGVTAAGYIDSLPMEGSIESIVAPEDQDLGPGELPPTRAVKFVSPGFLETLGAPLVAGRDLDWNEVHNQRDVAMISANFAKEQWGSPAEAIGKRIKVGVVGGWQEIVGVVADVYDNGPDQPAPGMVYWPAREHPFITSPIVITSVAFAMRTDRTGTESLLAEIRRAVAEVLPDQPVYQVQSLERVYEASMARSSFSLVLLGIAGGMALLLGIVGIYGVLAYAVAQRRREVGIRLALGAAPGAVQGMFVRRGLLLSGAGIVLGTGAAAALTQLMSSLLFGVTPVDAPTFSAAAAVLVVAALAASYVPARRAASVDPVETLRAQ